MHFVLLVSILAVFALFEKCPAFEQRQAQASRQTHPVRMVIFVHGVIGLKPHLSSVGNVIRIIQDDVLDSLYALSVEQMRRDPFFFQHHAMQEPGLISITPDPLVPGASLFAWTYQQFSGKPNDRYYTFGWSGLLSSKLRRIESGIFYEALKKEVARLKTEEGVEPTIKIIGYSHGGNITLNMAQFHESDTQKTFNKIDEVILIGVPLVADSSTFIHSPLFEAVYHFYSLKDRVQKMDFFASNRLFSSRTFKQDGTKPLPKKLTQIELRIPRIASRPKTCKCTTEREHALRKGRDIRDTAPGHSELWSFGWTPQSYRAYLPLYPLPIATITGYLVEKIKIQKLNGSLLRAEVWKKDELIVLKNQLSGQCYLAPFISKAKFDFIKSTILAARPKTYNSKIFHDKIISAISIAHARKKAAQKAEFAALRGHPRRRHSHTCSNCSKESSCARLPAKSDGSS